MLLQAQFDLLKKVLNILNPKIFCNRAIRTLTVEGPAITELKLYAVSPSLYRGVYQAHCKLKAAIMVIADFGNYKGTRPSDDVFTNFEG